MPLSRRVLRYVVALAAITVPAAALAAAPGPAAVELSGGTRVAQHPSLPKIHLENAQREQIRRAVLTEPTEIEFRLNSTKAAKSFTPAAGAALPKGLVPNSLPPAVLAKLPRLRDYGYVKMKGQILIVNALTRRIVNVFPETRPLT